MLPPGVEREWDQNPAWQQGLLIAYNQIRDYEIQKQENEFLTHMFKALAR